MSDFAAKWVAIFAFVSMGVPTFDALPLIAQTATAEFKVPALEVISVKPNKGGGGVSVVRATQDGFSAMGVPTASLIRSAYGARFFGDDQIVGMPSWATSERYDVQGKVSDADAVALSHVNGRQKPQMLQAMVQETLVERFGIKVHEEDREGPVYLLVVAKNGSKLKEVADGATDASEFKDPTGRAMPPGSRFQGPGQIVVHAVGMGVLAESLNGRITGRVVLDRTGLTGKYDARLTWAMELPSGPLGADSETSPDTSGSSIFTAIQEQLGLKLEPAKGPVKTLVIDHIERPSGN